MDTSSTTLFYQFTTGIMRKFAEGASLPYFQYPITSFWLVSWVTEGALWSYFQYNSILLVYDWYYVQVSKTWGFGIKARGLRDTCHQQLIF
jgi:hypothetical protein